MSAALSPAPPAPGGGLPRFARALGSRNYRVFFYGQVVSLVGTWMTTTTSLWLAYHLTGSPPLLGWLGFVGQIPIFLLSPFAGVFVDRTADKRRLLIITQSLALLQSAALAVLALTGTVTIWWLMGLNAFQGIINAYDMTCRQAFVIQLVDKREDLGNAIALNSSMFNLARLLGPAVGGLLIRFVGAGWCYAIDAVSYVAVILSLTQIVPRLVERAGPAAAKSFGRTLSELRAGVVYAFGFVPIGNLILLVAATAFTGFAAPVVMPIFARDIFGGDASTLGWLMSASGVGALAGAVYLSTRTGVRGLGRVITVGGVAMGVGWIGCALCRTLEPALLCLTCVGAGGVLLMASSNTVVQSLVDEDKRGRVMSLFAMAFTGTTPLGNFVLGHLAGGRVGVRAAVVGCGVGCVVWALAFLARLPRLRIEARPRLDALESVAEESVTT